MKVTTKESNKVRKPVVVNLELSEQEAVLLRALAGGAPVSAMHAGVNASSLKLNVPFAAVDILTDRLFKDLQRVLKSVGIENDNGLVVPFKELEGGLSDK